MGRREKVINGLECCKIPFTKCYDGGCPYFEDEGCKAKLKREALELLKAQEPRVLTLQEWKQAEEPKDGECMCYEVRNADGNTFLKAMLIKCFEGCENLYNKVFRVWTSCPTDSQREATPWER